MRQAVSIGTRNPLDGLFRPTKDVPTPIDHDIDQLYASTICGDHRRAELSIISPLIPRLTGQTLSRAACCLFPSLRRVCQFDTFLVQYGRRPVELRDAGKESNKHAIAR